MQMTQSGETLLDAIVESGLLAESVLHHHRGREKDVATLAKRLVKDRLLTPFQARVLLGNYPTELPSFFLTERYKILEHLGAGGMGEVYLAEHLLLRRVVALKMIVHGPKGSTSSNGGAVERFFREARVVAALDHPNVVRVFDMDRTPSGPFLVMEYVDGTNLHQLLRRQGMFSIERAVDAVKQAATGLGHAHGRGLIHRDVKPANMLLDRHGTVKVVDLGLASFRDVNENEGLTAAHNQDHLIGTADFVAPEQALDGSAADARSDMYSLGATLYYLLTGRPPFNEGTITQKLMAHQMKTPPPITEFRSDVPAELIEVVEVMMAKRPADRPADMAEAVALLEPFCPARLPPPPATEMPKHPPSAYKLGLAAAPPAAVTPSLASPNAVTKRMPKPPPKSGITGGSPKSSGSLSIRTGGPRSLSSSKIRIPVQDEEPVPVELVGSNPPAAVVPGPTSAFLNPSHVTRRATLLMGFGGGLAIVGGAMWYIFGRDPGPNQTSRPVVRGVQPSSPPPPPPVGNVVITGSGSTFIQPAMQVWAEKYLTAAGVKIDYKGIGSGKGIDNMLERVSMFGGTDVPLTDAQLKKAKDTLGDVVHVPLALGAVAVTYNLPDVTQPIKMTGSILADIYLGRIKKWNEDALAFVNPSVKLPDIPIIVVRRGDSSGTTGIWTDYLAKISGEWTAKVGQGTTVKWPIGIDAEKNKGVADLVTKTVGSIGYVELSYALERNLKVAAVKNKADLYVSPTLESVTAAAAAELQTLPADLRFSLVNAAGDNSYAIAGCAWAVVYAIQSAATHAPLVKFLRWLVNEGQADLPVLRYAPLPSSLVQKVMDRITTIRPDA